MDNILGDSLKNMGGLSALDTPIYLIGITTIIAITGLPNYEITATQWNILFALFLIILLATVFFTQVKQNHVTKNYELKVKLSRSGSIVAAIVAVLFANDEALRYPFLFNLIILAAMVQVVLFSVYLIIRERSTHIAPTTLKITRKPSYIQLALLTSAILIGIAKNSHNFGKHLILAETNLEDYYQPRADNLHKADMSLSKIIDKALDDRKADALKEEAAIKEKYLNVLTFREVTLRYSMINYCLLGIWSLTIILWIYVLFFKKDDPVLEN